ncbi:MAG: CDP-alcohol phosphatidyltransferase family protein [Desulfosarcina sp.]|nr:CDP-alcohol phosphatidyltransferase family protein [Desulfosarcina sp.]MBC2741717.1 CDP-alcohol phosphatidyltransferase family protein [Desulfosarcina sp.]MBC2764631.1 CDP-alcohol phosphatidyltransferase [Desulfosarcina sp.]
MTNPKPQQPHQPTMLSFAGDLPNICSLAGLLCAVLGIYYAILGNFPVALIGVLWAVLFDWADGIIARQMTGRTDHQRAFGGQFDSLIDIVSFGVFPAIFLLSYGQFSPWFLPGAFLLVATSAIRLSYFNIFGLIDNKTYMGLALDNNVIILAFVFLFEGFIKHTVFSIILYALLMSLLVFNVAPIRTPKFAGKWFYVLMGYTLVLTVIYGWMQWNRV